MDPASGVAGLIGLVALSVGTTAKLISFVQDSNDLSNTLAARLGLLGNYTVLLKDLQTNYGRAKALGIKIDTLNIELNVVRYQKNIETLVRRLENARKDITKTAGLERQVKKLMIIAKSSRIEKQFKLIQDDMDVLEKWRASLNSQLSSAGLESALEILKRHSAHHQLLSSITTDLHEVRQSHDWLLNLISTLPVEIREIVRSERLQLEGVFGQITKDCGCFKPDQHAIEEVYLVKSQSNNRTALDTGEDVLTTAKTEFITQDATYHTWRDFSQTTRNDDEDNIQARYHLCRKKTRNFLGDFCFEMCRIYKQSNGSVKELVEIQLSLIPDPRWLSRALQACILYDHTLHRQSLCQIKLHCPGIRRFDDALLDLLGRGSRNEFMQAMKDGNYRPDDLFFGEVWDPIPLIGMSFLTSLPHAAIYMLETWGPLPLQEKHHPLHYYLSVPRPEHGHARLQYWKAVELLLDHGMTDSVPSTFAYADMDTLYDMVKLFLRHPKALAREEIADELRDAIVFRSSTTGKISKPQNSTREAKSFESLFCLLGLDANARDEFGNTLLHKLTHKLNPREERF
ncbi:MAG: hypothetical protein M1821_007051 [Bathelium mastoideum]|nr:MAG: hypothetical protein M1821_007051 [Bathelium mastoideum]